MPRFFMSFAAAIGFLTLVGCPSADDRGGSESLETATSQRNADEGWTTVATLRSSDPTFQELDNIRVSEPFTATGDVRVVMEMPNAAPADGVVAVILPADKATDVFTMLKAIPAGLTVMTIGAAPTEVVPDLDGTYVLVNSVPAPREWILEVQVETN